MRALLDRWCAGFGAPSRSISAALRLPRATACGKVRARPDAAPAATTHAEMDG